MLNFCAMSIWATFKQFVFGSPQRTKAIVHCPKCQARCIREETRGQWFCIRCNQSQKIW